MGKALWNAENRFTGWVDVDLSEKGISGSSKVWTTNKKVRILI